LCITLCTKSPLQSFGSAGFSTSCPQLIHSNLCITGALVLLFSPCYDEDKSSETRVISMYKLSDETLLESYHKAVSLKLEEAFIELLLTEIRNRNLNVNPNSGSHAFHSWTSWDKPVPQDGQNK